MVAVMDCETKGSEERFMAYVEAVAEVIGHADREQPLRDYCLGLLMPCERKSVEPMAALVAPSRVSAEHQSLLHFVGQAPWSDEAVLRCVRDLVLPVVERQGPITAWIVDDTGFPKKGTHSVGVARQYCGRLGKQDNCQIAVTLSVANCAASLPVAYRLYLPEAWAADSERRAKAGVPDEVMFKTKPQIALDQVRAAHAAGIAPGVVLADAGYGVDGAFRAGVTGLGLAYAVGVQSTLSVWPPGREPLPPKAWSGRGRPPSLIGRSPHHQPVSAKTLATSLAEDAWSDVTWREGTNAPLSSRFAALRVRPASRDYKGGAPHPHEWLLVEWPDREAEPTRYWLSTLPDDTSLAALVETAKLAHRAGLQGSQRGTRAGPLRRPRLARLPSSRHAVHRRLRVPGLRTGRDSPLGDPETPSDCAIRQHPTRRIRRSGPNATSKPPSQRSEDGSSWPSPKRSRDARVAKRHGSYPPPTAFCNAVELER